MRTSIQPASRLTLGLVLSGILAILTVGGVAWSEATNSLLDSSFENLTSIETSKSRQIENYFSGVEDQIQQLAGDLTVIESTVRLTRSFDQIALEPVPEDVDASLQRHYNEEFLPLLAENSTGEPEYGIFEPGSQSAKVLQYHYISNNANAVGVKSFLDNAGDGSEYSRWHAHYHPGMRALLDKFQYYDLFLVDFDTGDIVYTVFKEADYGTNLLTGPYRNSGLGEVVREVMADPVRQTVQIVDFQPYAPSYNEPASFTAVPIYNGDHPVGILALQMPIDEIDAVMTSEENWQSEGMGDSGETYLVGADRLMRSNSRFLIEDKPGYLQAARSSGIAEDIVDRVDSLDSTILLQSIDTPAANDAIAGLRGSSLIENYRGNEVLSSFSPLDIRGLDWVILSEIDRSEALAPVDQLLRRVLIAAAFFVPLVALASIWLSRRFLRPVHDAVDVSQVLLDRRTGPHGMTDNASEAGSSSFDSDAPGAFGVLGANLNELITHVDAEKDLVDANHQQFMMRRTTAMPSAVGERVRKGELGGEDVAPRGYAVAVVVPALADGHTIPDQDGFEVASEFGQQLLASAHDHGVDLFSNIGFEYVGIVGLTASFLDSTDRAVRFAQSVLEITERVDPSGFLTAHVIIDASPMRGMMDDASLHGYTVQGDAIRRSQVLAGLSEGGSAWVTEEVRDQLVEADLGTQSQSFLIEAGEVQVWQLRQTKTLTKASLGGDQTGNEMVE